MLAAVGPAQWTIPCFLLLLQAFPFRLDPAECKLLWDMRKGIFPLVGGAREPGTTVMLEDVACPVDRWVRRGDACSNERWPAHLAGGTEVLGAALAPGLRLPAMLMHSLPHRLAYMTMARVQP